MADRVRAIQVFDVINGWKQIQHVRASTWAEFNKMVERFSQPLGAYSERQKLKLGWHSRYAVHALDADNEIIADNGGVNGAIRRFEESARKKAGNRTRGDGLGAAERVFDSYYLSKTPHGLFELRQARYRSQRLTHGGRGYPRDVVAVGTLDQLFAMDSTLPGAAAAVATYRRNQNKRGLGALRPEVRFNTLYVEKDGDYFNLRQRGNNALAARDRSLAEMERLDYSVPGAAAAVAAYRRSRGESGLGGTQAEHEDETAGAFEQVELFTLRGQDALNDLRAAPSTGTRRRALEALDMLSFWTGRAHQSQTHGNPLHKKGGVNPVNAATSLQADLRRALASCPCSTRTSR